MLIALIWFRSGGCHDAGNNTNNRGRDANDRQKQNHKYKPIRSLLGGHTINNKATNRKEKRASAANGTGYGRPPIKRSNPQVWRFNEDCASQNENHTDDKCHNRCAPSKIGVLQRVEWNHDAYQTQSQEHLANQIADVFHARKVA